MQAWIYQSGDAQGACRPARLDSPSDRWLWRERPDVLHAHLPHAAWLARWSRMAAPVPVVVDTLHSSHTGELGRRLGYVCSRWLHRSCDSSEPGDGGNLTWPQEW